MADTWVQHTADDFAVAIAGELPTGAAWPRDPDSDLIKWVAGCAGIWGDVAQAEATLLQVESDPRVAFQMLPDWERNFALPDPCIPVVQTLAERRVALVNKMTIQGGQSKAFFTALAQTLGYTIAIQEFRPFQFGLSSFGGRRGKFNPPGFRFVWRVSVFGPRVTRFSFGGSSFGRDSFLEIRRAEDLECMLTRWAPGHTLLIFNYSPAPVAVTLKRFQFGHSRFGNNPFSEVVTTTA